MTQTQYRLKNSNVQAVRYLGQPLDQLPEFVRNYSAFSAMSGQSKLGRNLVGNILIPHQGGYYTCVPGEWLILQGKQMTVLTDKGFNERFEAVDAPVVAEPVVEAPAPVVEAPAPVVEPAPTAAPVIEPAPTSAAPEVEQTSTGTPPADLTQTTSDASQQQ